MNQRRKERNAGWKKGRTNFRKWSYR